MSYAMKVARRGRYGDPGLFGVLGSVIKTVGGVAGGLLPGPAGTVVRGITSALPGKNLLAPRAPGPGTSGGLMLPSGSIPTISMPGTGATPLIPMGNMPTTTAVDMGGGAKGCNAGYRLNKSGYWSNKNKLLPGASWTAPGTACVKRRRMNPLNPRAISRAIRRIESAKRATSRLSKVTVRGGCGCK